MSMFSSLTQWSQQHIRTIFEAPTEEESLQAMRETFSPSIKANLNGKPLGFTDIRSMVLLMRNSSPNGLKIRWLQAVEAPYDASNRVCHEDFHKIQVFYSHLFKGGFLGGSYIINGIFKIKTESEKPAEYYRHKTVIVK